MENNYLDKVFQNLEQGITSISNEARELGIDRKTLKERLKKYDLSRYKQFESRRNKQREKRRAIAKKKTSEKSEEYKNNIELLDKMGITEAIREEIYKLLNQNKHTKMAKDTYANKLLEMMLFFTVGRNKEIDKKSIGYITRKDIINMIMLNPKITTNDVKRKMQIRCEQMDGLSWGTKEKTNQIVIKYPTVFDESHERFRKQMIVLSNFMILLDGAYVQEASEYVLWNKANQQLKTSPEKMYQRLMAFSNKKQSNIFTEEEYWSAIRDKSMDKENEKRFPLPKYESGKEDEFINELKEKIQQNGNNPNREIKRKGEE